MNPSSLPVQQRIALLVQALDGAEKTNKALATCPDGDAMVDILLGASAKLGLGPVSYTHLTLPTNDQV